MSEPSKSLMVATVVPAPKSNPSSPHQVMGTKVLLSDGSELAGVLSVELKASVDNGAWHAVITVMPREIPAVSAEARVVEVDVTSLADETRRYAQVER
ncbi:hypothetical protein [Pseudomonas sp. URIL14HWK12:I5]|uniref:hypothetical protein n=1 Tax=Pseudomonas sp. URIL14HWK12:I5 TaxID=1261630 RepID=UPI0009D8B276|nr:hypothetical protein [Pseudomonas sp. URIL14HWK12:I5]SMC69810.1 hypothetical protein SAMN05660385_02069 [Pseudomonas sp. URIL14HWK12:I5]